MEGTNNQIDNYKNNLGDKNSQKSLDDIVKEINEKTNITDTEKANLIIPLITKSATQGNIINFIKETKIEDDNEKFKIISKFLSLKIKSNIVDIIKETEIKDDYVKTKIIQSYILNQEKLSINQNEVIQIIKEVGINNEIYKSDIIKSFLANFWFSSKINLLNDNPDSYNYILTNNATPENFVKIINDFELQNRVDLIVDLYKYAYQNPQGDYVKNFIHIAKSLHSSELMQFELIMEGIKFNGVIKSNNVQELKPFIEGLKDNELALNLIENLHVKRFLPDEKDILSLVKNRSKKQYNFITKILEDKTLDDCINEDGKVKLKLIFGDALTIDEEPITISQLISYYDLKNQVSDLSAMLNPEFKKQLRDNFLPSSEIFLYKSQELEKLNQLLSEEGVDFDVKTYFIENKKLCDFLRDKVGNIVEIDPEKTYQINFKKFIFSEEGREFSPEEKQKIEQEQQEINVLFNQILKDSDPDPITVRDFFRRLLTEFEFPEDEKNKLNAFFENNKKEIAHCFCGDEHSSQDFKYSLMTLKDGCFANIGMQFRKALYATIIEDEDAQIFYKFADYEIFSEIINHHGEDIMFRVEAPFDNKEINLYYLSPTQLISKLAKEESLTVEKSWAIIRRNIGDEVAMELMGKMMEETQESEKIDQKTKEIASYFVVNMVVDENKMQDLQSKDPQLKKLSDIAHNQSAIIFETPSPNLDSTPTPALTLDSTPTPNSTPSSSPRAQPQSIANHGGCFTCLLNFMRR